MPEFVGLPLKINLNSIPAEENKGPAEYDPHKQHEDAVENAENSAHLRHQENEAWGRPTPEIQRHNEEIVTSSIYGRQCLSIWVTFAESDALRESLEQLF